jgi:hypothetical protein
MLLHDGNGIFGGVVVVGMMVCMVLTMMAE